jgi:hypothetical protein
VKFNLGVFLSICRGSVSVANIGSVTLTFYLRISMNLYPFFPYLLTDVGELQHEYLDLRNVNFMTIGAIKTILYLWMKMRFSLAFYNFLSIWTIFGIDVNKNVLSNKDFLNNRRGYFRENLMTGTGCWNVLVIYL